MITKGRSCIGKRSLTRTQAKSEARRLRRLWQRVHAYPCLYGDHWHVGHRSWR